MKIYVYRYIVSLTALLFLSFAKQAVANEAVVVDSLSFKIEKVSYGQWSKPRHHMINDMVEHIDQGTEALSYIALTYTLTNANKNKKIDLDGKFNYGLFDNYGNRYRAMRKPENYTTSVLTVSKNFPSLYPGEVYGETLFFEAPVSTANNLILAISSDDLKLSRPVELTFFPKMIDSNVPSTVNQTIRQVSEKQNSQPVSLPEVSSGLTGIKIVSPQPGIVWDQGQAARIEIASLNGQSPKKVIVIGLDTTFQDLAPQGHNVYDINIPLDTTPGSYTINVIAQWASGEISSDLLLFYVKDSTPLGIL